MNNRCRLAFLMLAIWLPAVLPGCATTKPGAGGAEETSALMPGTPRKQVIAELGAPAWSGENEGIVTDLFVIKRPMATAAKTGRWLLQGAANVVTFGLWEFVGTPTEPLTTDTDVRLEVRYDRQGALESVRVVHGKV